MKWFTMRHGYLDLNGHIASSYIAVDFVLCVGLKRSGKSCRLRWMNYLRPSVKRGHISADDEELIIKLHKLLGNRYEFLIHLLGQYNFKYYTLKKLNLKKIS